MAREVADRVERAITVPAGEASLDGNLTVPAGANGIVLFAHGSGSSRSSPRNVWVAGRLQRSGVRSRFSEAKSGSRSCRARRTCSRNRASSIAWPISPPIGSSSS